jgi:hypothetical protein
LALIGLVAMSGVPYAALAQGVEQPAGPGTVRQFIAQSDLVFHGSVVAVEYVNSLPAADSAVGIPHTFVTYRVHDVMHGQVDGEEITLRFLGGYDPVSETYLAASVSPQFDLGDEDVLFVRGNGVSPCPLVDNSRGRLRVIAGQVYSDTGRALSLMPDGTILRGARYDLPEVWMTDVLGEVLAIGRDPDVLQGPSDAVSRERLLRFVEASGMNAAPSRARFTSADMHAPFESPMPVPAPMRDSMPADAPPAELDERDLPAAGTTEK